MGGLLIYWLIYWSGKKITRKFGRYIGLDWDYVENLSKKFIEFCKKIYTEEAKVRLFGEPYARMDLADKLKDNPYAAPFIEQAATAQSTIFYGETHDNNIDGKLNGYLGNAIRSAKSNITTEKAVETLSQGVSQVLSQYGIR